MESVSSKIVVKVQPGAKHTEVVAISPDNAIKIRVSAPPVEGKANLVLLEFLKEVLKIKQSQLEIVHGETSRTKIIRITGIESKEIYQLLEKMINKN